MDVALLKKGIDDVARDGVADTVGFHILGEPLACPGVFDAIRYAHGRGLKTELNTNGSLLSESNVARLADAGLDLLSISVQVLGEENFASRGAPIAYDQYYGRIMEALGYIRACAPRMDVILCFMNTSTEKLFDMGKRVRVSWREDRSRMKLLFFLLDIFDAIKQKVAREDVALVVRKLDIVRPKMVRLDDRTAVYVQPLGDWGNAFTQRKVHPSRIGYCGYCLQNVGVLNTGEVTVCCVDYDGATSLGNVRDESLASLLAGEKAQAIRDGFARNKVVHPYCQRCVGSPNPVKALFKGLASIYLFRVLRFEPARVKEVPLLASAVPCQPSAPVAGAPRTASQAIDEAGAAPVTRRASAEAA
jgi:MoaA/NifB/PqqE/SkfB family radical SAM enzyme